MRITLNLLHNIMPNYLSFSRLSGVKHVDKAVVIFAFSSEDTFCPLFLTVGATGQGFTACLPTGGDGIQAAPPFRVAQFQQFG